MPEPTQTVAKKGLEDIIAGESSICFIDGQRGRLVYRGYDIHDLVKGSFEESAYLLIHGDLPKAAQLAEFSAAIQKEMSLPDDVVGYLRSLPASVRGMEALRTAISLLSAHDDEADDTSTDANRRKAVRLLARAPLIVATLHRLRSGGGIVAPRADRGIAWNFLWMTFGSEPTEAHARMIDTALILHADHEFNASTFTARVIAATLSDMYSAAVGAIGALKGPLHGGANEQVMRMLLEIGSSENALPWIQNALAEKRKIMGFGHRVYRTEDPRATHLRQMSEQLGNETGQIQWFSISRQIEQFVLEQKKLYPNVDFYSASTYYMLNIPVDLYTPIFAMSRMAGWCAHVMEQQADNRLIRPAAEYVGHTDRKYAPVAAR